MSTADYITGQCYKIGTTQGIWPTEVEVNARIFDDLVEEWSCSCGQVHDDGVRLEYSGRCVVVNREPAKDDA